MSKVIKNGCGKYFVSGSGFTGTESTATAYPDTYSAQKQVYCLASVGIKDVAIVNQAPKSTGSFAVNYIRPEDVRSNGQISNSKLNPSKRRFATLAEAIQHGSRFNTRRKNQGDKPGTAGHVGFYVSKTNDPVNAVVNWETGLTNPI